MSATQYNETFLYNWCEECDKENIILCFHGDFDQDLVNSILVLSEVGQQVQSSTPIVKARLFSSMVECMQNIRKYGVSSMEGSDLKPGIVIVCFKNGNYTLFTGNLVPNKEVPVLKEKLEKLKILNKEELKAMNKKVLGETQLSEKSGAGLGLISIARKSDGFNFKFKQISDKLSFYELAVTISTDIK